jgi:hypothetical protein
MVAKVTIPFLAPLPLPEAVLAQLLRRQMVVLVVVAVVALMLAQAARAIRLALPHHKATTVATEQGHREPA